MKTYFKTKQVTNSIKLILYVEIEMEVEIETWKWKFYLPTNHTRVKNQPTGH